MLSFWPSEVRGDESRVSTKRHTQTTRHTVPQLVPPASGRRLSIYPAPVLVACASRAVGARSEWEARCAAACGHELLLAAITAPSF